MKLAGELHIVVAVDAKHILNYIAGTLHIDAIGGHEKVYGIVLVAGNLHFKRSGYGIDCFGGDGFSDEGIEVTVVEFDGEGLDRFGV